MRVLVVDDEPLARRRLIRMLEAMPGVAVAGEAADGEAALRAIRALAPDVVLLDIRMPGLDGLSLALSGEALPPIIFTTAHDEYALQAFEAAAVDYLLKPVEAERLSRALERVERVARGDHEPLTDLLRTMLDRARPGEFPRAVARSGDTTHVFDARRISLFRAADKYSVFRVEGREYLMEESLDSLEARLAPHGFFRAHRAALVNLAHVQRLRSEDDGLLADLAGGETAPVARRAAAALRKRLGITAG